MQKISPPKPWNALFCAPRGVSCPLAPGFGSPKSKVLSICVYVCQQRHENFGTIMYENEYKLPPCIHGEGPPAPGAWVCPI